MHSSRTGRVACTSIARPATSDPAVSGKSVGSDEMRWLGARSAVCSNQNVDNAVRTRPLSGTRSSSTTSNTEMRSDATIRMRSWSTSYRSRILPVYACGSAISVNGPLSEVPLSQRVHDARRSGERAAEVEACVEAFGGQRVLHLGILGQHVAERTPFLPRAGRGSLHDAVGIVTGATGFHQREQDGLAE